MSMTAWVVWGVLAAVVIWAIAAYNRLVQLRNRIANAFAQIDVQLKRRHDLVPNLVEVARGYLKHEAALSEELTSTENRLGFARQAYNDEVLDFNNDAAQFPTLIVARLLGFVSAPMLEATRSEAERAAPTVQF